MVLSVLLSVFVAACAAPTSQPTTPSKPAPAATPTPTPTPKPAAPATFKWPDKLVIVTAQLGGTVYQTFAAWTAVFSNKTGVDVRVVPEDNEALRKKMVQKGDAFMCGFNEGTKSIYEASGVYATRDGGPWPAQSVWTLTVGYYSFMVKGDSSIKSMADIKKGVRIAHMPAVPDMKDVYLAFLAWAGLAENDAVWVPYGSFATMIRSIPEGKADVAFVPGLTHAAVQEAEVSPGGIRWIALDPNANPTGAAKYIKIRPSTLFAKVPPGYGVPSVIGTPGVLTVSTMGVRSDADTELVYNLTKWLHQNFNDYKGKYIGCEQSMSIDILQRYLEVSYDPFHEGTIKYLKEIGKWSADDDLRQAYNVKLGNRYIDAYKKALAKADEMQVPVSPTNEAWINLWNSYKDQLPPFQNMTIAQIKAAGQ